VDILETLEALEHPVWLWEPERARIVWANPAALVFFDERSVTELAERSFGQDEPFVAAARKAAVTKEPVTISASIFGCRSPGPIRCRLAPHVLPDHREGLMVEVTPNRSLLAKPGAPPLSQALALLSVPVLIAQRSGDISYANEAARALFPAPPRNLIAALGEELASRLVETLDAGGRYSRAVTLATRYGLRRHRVDAMRLRDPGTGEGLTLVCLRDLADRLALEELESARRARLDAFLAAAADFTWECDDQGRLTAIGPGFLRLTGLLAPQVKGRHWHALAPGPETAFHLPEAPHPFRDMPLTVRHVDGTAVTMLLSARPIVDDGGAFSGYRGVGRLLDPALLAAADEEAARALALLEALPDGLFVLDEKGVIAFANKQAAALLGTTPEALRGHRFAALLDPDGRKEVHEALSRAGAGAPLALLGEGSEVCFSTAEGIRRSFLLAFRRLDLAAGAAFCALIRDMSPWHAIEAELTDARDAALRANRQKSEFLAKVSHELRTPLNAIMGFAEIMRDERLGPINNPRYLGYLRDIHHSGQLLLSLINDLLDLSKVEAGKLELKFTNVDVARVIERCTSLMEPAAQAARVAVAIEIAPDLPAIVADERSLEQIVLNLLSNAVKYTGPGGRVRVVAAMNAQGGVDLSVQDTGIGMTQADLRLALEPYRRAESRELLDKPGTGLGLPLAKALAEANRAEFRIESAPKAGTSIEIRFPAARVLAG
jgi:PAS domain S-box-containing protein